MGICTCWHLRTVKALTVGSLLMHGPLPTCSHLQTSRSQVRWLLGVWEPHRGKRESVTTRKLWRLCIYFSILIAKRTREERKVAVLPKKIPRQKTPQNNNSSLLIFMSESVQFSPVAQSCPTLRPHESQHTRPPCPSPTPGVYSNPCPSSRWCHPAISSSSYLLKMFLNWLCCAVCGLFSSQSRNWTCMPCTESSES